MANPYGNFRVNNSQLVNRRGSNVDAALSNLQYFQQKHDSVINKKTMVDAALEDFQVADSDKGEWNKFKSELDNEISSIGDSRYAGDYDNLITRAAMKAKTIGSAFQANQKAKEEYIESARKEGLDENRIQEHLSLSQAMNGKLKYEQGQVKNKFQGIALHKGLDDKNVREWLTLIKPTKTTIETTNGKVTKEVYNPYTKENQQILRNAAYADDSYRKELEYNRLKAAYQADKVKLENLDEQDQQDILNRVASKQISVKDAIRERLIEDSDKSLFGQVIGVAALKAQNDISSELGINQKNANEFGWWNRKQGVEMSMWNRKQDRELQDFFKKEDYKASLEEKKEGEGIVVTGETPNFNDPNIPVDSEGKVKTQGFWKSLERSATGVLKYFGADSKAEGRKAAGDITQAWKDWNSKPELGEWGDSYLRTASPNFGRKYREYQRNPNEKLASELDDLRQSALPLMAKAAQETSKAYALPTQMKLGKKSKAEDEARLEQMFGSNLSGGIATTWKAKKFNEDKSLSNVMTVGDIQKELDIDLDKEVRKAIKDGSPLVTLEGVTTSVEGDLGRGIVISINDPENPTDPDKKTKILVEVPTATTQQGKIQEELQKAAVKADRQNISTIGEFELHRNKNKYGNSIYSMYDKNGKLIRKLTRDQNNNIVPIK